jgi:membrane associated rhomboid family serine protease
MKGQTSKVLRIVLLVFAIYYALYGLLHVLFPVLAGPKDPSPERILGAAFITFALGALLSYLEKSWEKVRIVVQLQIVWLILYVITMAWGLLEGGIDAVAWIFTIIGAVFAILFAILYFREERLQKQ